MSRSQSTQRVRSRRMFLATLGAGMGAVVLAACAPAAPPTATPAPKPAPTAAPAAPQPTPAPKTQPSAGATKVRVTVWVGQAERDALAKMTQTYLEKQPSVEVEWINIQGGGLYGRDKLQTMLAGGDAPDLMMLNTGQFEGLAARNVLRALDDFVRGESFDLNIFWPQAVEGSRYQGKLYGLPRDISNVILYYNKDLFDKAGVAYPTGDWTWNHFLEAAKRLTLDKDKDGKVDQWGFAFNNIVWVWAGFVWANGGEVLSPDRKQCLLTEAKTLEALKFYYDLMTEHKVAPPPGSLPEQPGASPQFLNQSAALGLFGPWYRPTMVNNQKPFKWDVSYPPKAPSTGKRGSVVYTDHWGMYQGTKVAQETWAFQKFLTSKQGQQQWTDLIGARSISPVKEVAQSEKWLRYGGSSGEIILECLGFSQAPPVNFSNANEAENIWNDELGLVITGQLKVEQAAKNICTKIAPVLARS
ncbi:MAG: sugar ABC transporter substrate-binding protein [Chloroflexi bacterium]|nr:sugar ABC transporter substrate-binding protein [Chloroflexota bacterium]